MGIAFTQIPDNLLVPGHYQEIDNSEAGVIGSIKRVMIPGIKTSAGSASPGLPVVVSSEARSRSLLGAGSPLALMVQAFLSLNKVEEVWALPLAENPAGTKAVKKITVATAGAKAGTLTRYIAGLKVQIATTDGISAADAVTNLVAAINATLDMPVEASVDAGNPAILVLTSLVKGEVGNGFSWAAGLYGETDPEGVTLNVTSETAGTGNPAGLANALQNLGGVRYNFFVTDLVDAASLAVFAADLDDRYSALRQIGGRLFFALSGEVGDATTNGSIIKFLQGVNCPHLVPIPRGKNPQMPGVFAARIAAKAVRTLADDPGANTLGIEVSGLIATEQYDFGTRQKLLEAGCSTWTVTSDGTVVIERLVTSYTENNEGDRDTSYLDIQVVELADAIRTYRNSLASKRYKGWKLASTTENFGSGSKVMTPSIWRSFLIEVYQQVFILEKQWCQDLETYKDSIQVELKTGSKTRLDYRDQPILIGQFYIGAGLMQFK